MKRSGWQSAIFLAAALLASALPRVPVAAQQQAAAAQEQPAPPDPTTLPGAQDPLVQALLETDPQQPAELAATIRTLLNLGYPELARVYAQRLLDANLDDPAALDLLLSVGQAMLVRFSVAPELQPTGRELADRILDGAKRAAADPAQLAAAVQQLEDPQPTQRAAALDRLRFAGPAAIDVLLGVLLDPAEQARHAAVRRALVSLGTPAVPPLTEIARQADSPASLAAIQTLGSLPLDADARLVLLTLALAEDAGDDVRRAAGGALGQAGANLPAPAAVAAVLDRRAAKLYHQQQPLPEDSQGRVAVWRHDGAALRTTQVWLPAAAASAELARRWAEAAWQLAPTPQRQRRYLAAAFEAAAYELGRDTPLPADHHARIIAQQAGAAVVNDVLHEALHEAHPVAAALAAELLGGLGDPSLLSTGGGQPAPLALALRASDPRVRFAAASSVMRLAPAGSFAGSSYLPDAWLWFASSGGRRKALAVAHRSVEAHRLAGLLVELGYEGQAETDPKAAFRRLSQEADFEVVLIAHDLPGPSARDLLYWLRIDYRTARLPAALVSSAERLGEVQRWARDRGPTAAIVRPLDRAGLEPQLVRLLVEHGGPMVPVEVRLAQARAALAQLRQLTAADPARYNQAAIQAVAEPAALHPELSGEALALLAGLGTHSSQRYLADLASQNSLPEAPRRAAVAAFGAAVERFGLRLTPADILRQYDRYNQSEFADQATQEILGALLDCLEGEPHAGRDAPDTETDEAL